MDEDLDKVVESFAAKLTTYDHKTIAEVYQALEDVYVSGDEGREKFSRIAQELAVYQNGAALKPLLFGALEIIQMADLTERMFYFRACCLAIKLLISSDVVVKKCLMGLSRAEHKQTARMFYETLTGNALRKAHALQKGQASAATLYIVKPLECLTKFTRGFRVFRDAMKDVSEERTIHETLGYFLSAEFLSKLSDQEIAGAIRIWLSEVAVSLAFSEDSQLWVLDKGLLKVLAAIYESAHLQNLSDGVTQTESPVSRCNAILLYSLGKEATREKLRAHNALPGFRPHKRKINSADSRYRPWSFIEAKLQGRPMRAKDLDIRLENIRDLMQQPNPGNWAPTVCSWKLCTAGPEAQGDGEKYGKCAGCQVARYCR